MSDNTSATDLYGDGELPGDADLVAPAASSKTVESDSTDAPDRNADTNTEGNIDINLEDSGNTVLPDGPGRDGGAPAAGTPLP